MAKSPSREAQDRLPSWAANALQGLTFWIGHRKSLYPHHPLGESALVAETCNLIAANLDRGEALLCEQQFAHLVPKGAWPSDLGAKARADLFVVRDFTPSRKKVGVPARENLSVLIEVKRASAGKRLIDQDLERLATFKHSNPQVRALLFVIAEGVLPKRFVNPQDGKAVRGKHDIAGVDAYYQIRRVCKATASFEHKEHAHFACVIEVYLEGNTKRSPSNKSKG